MAGTSDANRKSVLQADVTPNYDVFAPVDLDIGRCRMMVCGLPNEPKQSLLLNLGRALAP